MADAVCYHARANSATQAPRATRAVSDGGVGAGRNLKIEAAAPTRVDLAGATLDIWPLYLFHPGAMTVNGAITRRARCSIETQRHARRITLISRDTARRESFASLEALLREGNYKLPLLAHLAKLFCERARPRTGFTLATDSQAPAGAGLGGSSAMALAICAALDRFTGARLDRQDWIHTSRDVEAIVIGVPTGTQDHYPAAFGGISAIHLQSGGEWREALPVRVEEVDRRLVLCYTGKPRQSGINNWEVFQAHIDGNDRVRKNLEMIAVVARQVRAALVKEDWSEVGRLMRQEWSARRRNLPTISTPIIDRIISEARKNGALAGKVCGAGGGGCVTLLIEPEARGRVETAVTKAGGQLLPMKIDRRGVQIRHSP
jgi:D-glycero-alpha-D-manno-heptose-7-phosphate kinase